MRRVGKQIPSIFRNDPVEIFIPVFKRDLDVFELASGPYVFVRSNNFPSLLRLKTITGVVSLSTIGDSNRPSKAIKVDDDYVQGIIANAKEEFRARSLGIKAGSFIRVLNGEMRDFCGVVEVIGGGKAIVRITLKTKSILLETPVQNLLNIPDVPPNQQVYYFGPLVSALVKELGGEGLKLIEDDLHPETLPLPASDYTPPEPKKRSRQRTITALLKKLVLVENLLEPMELAKRVVAAVKQKEVRTPKNVFIIFTLVKDTLLVDYFKRIDPSLHSYREVIQKFGNKYKFSVHQVAAIDPTLGLPTTTSAKPKIVKTKRRRGRPRLTPLKKKLKVV